MGRQEALDGWINRGIVWNGRHFLDLRSPGDCAGSYDQNPKERTQCVRFSAFDGGLTWAMTRLFINDLPSLTWGDRT